MKVSTSFDAQAARKATKNALTNDKMMECVADAIEEMMIAYRKNWVSLFTSHDEADIECLNFAKAYIGACDNALQAKTVLKTRRAASHKNKKGCIS